MTNKFTLDQEVIHVNTSEKCTVMELTSYQDEEGTIYFKYDVALEDGTIKVFDEDELDIIN